MITYKKLFHLLLDRNIRDSELRKLSNISAPTLSKLRNDQIIRTDIINKVCLALNCQPGDIMEYIEGSK